MRVRPRPAARPAAPGCRRAAASRPTRRATSSVLRKARSCAASSSCSLHFRHGRPGLDIGRAFRRLEMTTTVGKTTFLPGNGEPRATLSPKGTCASMCAFALLGGVRRHVPAEARVMVHQIWPSAKREDAASQTYVAENLSRCSAASARSRATSSTWESTSRSTSSRYASLRGSACVAHGRRDAPDARAHGGQRLRHADDLEWTGRRAAGADRDADTGGAAGLDRLDLRGTQWRAWPDPPPSAHGGWRRHRQLRDRVRMRRRAKRLCDALQREPPAGRYEGSPRQGAAAERQGSRHAHDPIVGAADTALELGRARQHPVRAAR